MKSSTIAAGLSSGDGSLPGDVAERPPGYPAVGSTDRLKNRPPENPTLGKPDGRKIRPYKKTN